jgi:hypothetical protein
MSVRTLFNDLDYLRSQSRIRAVKALVPQVSCVMFRISSEHVSDILFISSAEFRNIPAATQWTTVTKNGKYYEVPYLKADVC